MRVVIVSEYFEKTVGGVSAYVRCLTSALAAAGADVVVLTQDSTGSGVNDSAIRLRGHSRVGLARHVFSRLVKLRPEIVHVHGPWFLLLGAVAYRHRERSIGLVATQHTLPNKKYYLLKRVVESHLLKRCDAVAAPAEATLRALEDVAGVQLPSRRVCIGSGPGAVPTSSRVRETHFERAVIGTCGILVYPEKIAGVNDLVRAMAVVRESHPAIELIVAGGSQTGEGERAVAQTAKDVGLSKELVITGTVSDPWKHLCSARVYVHASHRESLPLAVLEAMAHAIPVIAADVGGLREVIRDGENGFLYRPGDVEHLAELIVLLLNDESLAQRCIEEGKRTIRERYNWVRVAQAHMDLYSSLLVREKCGEMSMDMVDARSTNVRV